MPDEREVIYKYTDADGSVWWVDSPTDAEDSFGCQQNVLEAYTLTRVKELDPI